MKEMDGESDATEKTDMMLIFRLVPKKIYGCVGSYKRGFSVGKYRVILCPIMERTLGSRCTLYASSSYLQLLFLSVFSSKHGFWHTEGDFYCGFGVAFCH